MHLKNFNFISNNSSKIFICRTSNKRFKASIEILSLILMCLKFVFVVSTRYWWAHWLAKIIDWSRTDGRLRTLIHLVNLTASRKIIQCFNMSVLLVFNSLSNKLSLILPSFWLFDLLLIMVGLEHLFTLSRTV